MLRCKIIKSGKYLSISEYLLSWHTESLSKHDTNHKCENRDMDALNLGQVK